MARIGSVVGNTAAAKPPQPPHVGLGPRPGPALADSVAGICAFLDLPEGAGASTVESKTNFLRPVTAGTAWAVCHPLHVGRQAIVLATEIRNDAGKLVAFVTQTQAVLRPT